MTQLKPIKVQRNHLRRK